MALPQASIAVSRAALLSVAVFGGCRDKTTEHQTAARTANSVASATPSSPLREASSRVASARPTPAAVTSAPRSLGVGPFVLGARLVDLGPGKPVALSPMGALFRRKDDDIVLVRLADRVAPLDVDMSAFSRAETLVLAHGSGARAYWATAGKLVRRNIDAAGALSPVETLAEGLDAGALVQGATTEAPSDEPQDVVAFVAPRRPKESDHGARVWIERKGVFDLSTEGSGATGVWVEPIGPSRFALLWLDARSALALVHARTLDLATGEPRFGRETIAWIAPPSDLVMRLSAVHVADTAVVLMAIPRGATRFGLASAPVHFDAPPIDDALWFDYPNGLDPAPVAPARFCGLPAAVIVAPTAAQADAPRAASIVTVDARGTVSPRIEIARAARIDYVSAWAAPNGEGWAAWVGDGRTLARRVSCKRLR